MYATDSWMHKSGPSILFPGCQAELNMNWIRQLMVLRGNWIVEPELRFPLKDLLHSWVFLVPHSATLSPMLYLFIMSHIFENT